MLIRRGDLSFLEKGIDVAGEISFASPSVLSAREEKIFDFSFSPLFFFIFAFV